MAREAAQGVAGLRHRLQLLAALGLAAGLLLLPGKWTHRLGTLIPFDPGAPIHIALFALLGACLNRTLAAQLRPWQVVALTCTVGALFEGLQLFVGREPSATDLALDAAGGLIGVAIAATPPGARRG